MVPIVLGSEPSYFCIVEKTSGTKLKFLSEEEYSDEQAKYQVAQVGA